MSRLRESPLYEKASLREILEKLSSEADLDGLDLEKVDQVFGSASAPESIGIFDSMQPGDDIPMEFFVRIAFSDASAATEVYENFEKKSKTVTQNGKTYLRPKREQEPQNVSISKFDEKTLEFGTDAYVMSQARNFRTERLAAAWSRLPEHALRVAIDMESADTVVNEALQLARQQVPPQAHMFIDLFEKISTLQLALDLDADPLLALSMEGKDDESTKTLQQGLEGLLGMARFSGKQAVAQLAQGNPELGKVATAILAS